MGPARRRGVRAHLLLLAIITLAPASLAQVPGQDFTMLHIRDYVYLPDPLEVTPGLTVVIMSFPDTNKTAEETEPHTVTDVREPPAFDVREIPPDTSQHPFTAPAQPGTYPYFCRYHGDRQGSGMVGTLIVREAAATPPPAASPTPTSETPLPAILGLAALAGAALARRRAD